VDSRLLCLFFIAVALQAQSVVSQTPDRPDSPQSAGGYTISNSFETGYRFADVSGNRDAYRAAINYGSGMRLFEGSLRMHSEDGKGKYFDEFSFHTMGAATDPYQFHNVHAEKNGLYRYDSRIRLVRYDNQLPALWQGERGMETERLFQNHDLTLFPGSRFEILLGYDRNEQTGPGFSSEGIPSSDGALRSDNFLRLTTDLRRVNNNYRIGTNFRALGLAVTAIQSFDNYKEDSTFGNGLGLPSNVTNVQPVDSIVRAEPYHGNTPVTMVALRTEKERWIGVSGRFVYSNGNRNWALSETVDAFNPQSSAQTLRQTMLLGDASREQGSGDFTVSLTPSEKITLTNTTAVSSTRIHGGASFLEVSRFTNQFLDFEELGIRFITNATELNVRPVEQFGVYGAYRFSTRRVRSSSGREFPGFAFRSPELAVDNDVHAGAAGLRWLPAPGMRASFDVEVGRADRPLTPISDRRFHNETARLQWRGKGASVSAHFKNRINNNPTQLVNYASAARSGGVQVSWARPDAKVTIDAGYGYLHMDSSAGIFDLFEPDRESPTARTVYTSNLHTVNFGARIQPHARMTLYLGYALSKDVGDGRDGSSFAEGFEAGYQAFSFDGRNFLVSFPLTYQTPQGRLSVQLNEQLAWNFGWQFYSYAEQFTGVQNYSAHVGYSSLRWSF